MIVEPSSFALTTTPVFGAFFFLFAMLEYQAKRSLEIGFDDDGRIIAYRDHFLTDIGAFNPIGSGVMYNTIAHLAGPYRIDHFSAEAKIVTTNKVPNAPYRGAGRPEAALVTERAMDLIAGELGIEPAEVRRRNMIRPEQMPYKLGIVYRDGEPIVYDGGDYPGALQKALAVYADGTRLVPSDQPIGADHATKPAGEHRDLICWPARRTLVPQAVDQPVHPDGPAPPEREHLEHGPHLTASETRRIAPLHLEISQQPHAEGLHHLHRGSRGRATALRGNVRARTTAARPVRAQCCRWGPPSSVERVAWGVGSATKRSRQRSEQK